MKEMKDRIQLRMKELNLKAVDVVRITGASKGTVSNWMNGVSRPSGDNLMNLAKALQIEASYLVDGKETIKTEFKNKLSIDDIQMKFGVERDPSFVAENTATYNDAIPLPQFVNIPYYDEVELSMGNGEVIYHEEPTKYWTFNSTLLKELDVDPEFAVMVRCKGESMMDRIADGDVALIKTNIEQIEDGRCYAINYDGEAKLKRLIKRANGSLIIRSDNENGRWPDEVVEPDAADDLRIIGMAVFIAGKV